MIGSKLRTKILAGYGVIFVLIVFVGGWGIVNLRRLGNASNAILQENYRSILAAENMIDAIERQDSATLLILLEDEVTGTQQFRANEIEFLQWLGRAKDNVTIPGEAEILTTLRQRYEQYLIGFSQLQQLPAESETDGTEFYYETLLPAFQQVRQSSIDLRELNQETMVAASQRTQQIAQQAIASMVIAGAIAAGLGLAFSLLLSRRIINPLWAMTIATGQIAEGDYDVAIPVNSNDELGRLATEITQMSQRLKAFHKLNVGQVIAEKQRSDAIIRSITDGIVVVDDRLPIIAINPTAAALFQTSPEQAQTRHFLEVVRHQELYEHIRATAETGQPEQLLEERSILTIEQNNHKQYYRFDITPVTTTAGTMLGVVLLLQNFTKLKELDQLKSEFVATASHELRTPLTSTAMSIDLLLEGAASKLTEREQGLLHVAQEEVQRLRTLVNDLLDLSKIESGRIEMDFTAVEPVLLVDKAVSRFTLQANEQEVALIQTIPPDLPLVQADPNKITWVLTNLIANALRYSDSGGQIQVLAEQHGGQIHFAVRDQGTGIPFEYQSKIFDKFVQVGTSKDAAGSGLGLAICKEIVKAHGGSIWVDSVPGKGSAFTFTLPIAPGAFKGNK
jgi:two-component system, NtrC family, sensor histidine kinase KinB